MVYLATNFKSGNCGQNSDFLEQNLFEPERTPGQCLEETAEATGSNRFSAAKLCAANFGVLWRELTLALFMTSQYMN